MFADSESVVIFLIKTYIPEKTISSAYGISMQINSLF